MRYLVTLLPALFTAALLFGAVSSASAQARLGLQLAHDCGHELVAHCGDVTVGGGRKVACLFAYHDRLSVKCALTLHKATVFAEKSMAAMRRVVNQCGADIDQHCSKIIPGQGRVALCLLANRPSLSRGCHSALAPLGRNP